MRHIFLGTVLLLLSLRSQGFVENVTHGYTNCMACHISPSGGGLLSDYGRSLSKELMSTWGWKNSEQPLFGAVKNRDWLKVGGDYRSIQTYLENTEVKQGRLFTMQSHLELGLYLSKIWLVGTLGLREGPEGTPKQGEFLSERHYALWDVTDEIKLRAGKFRLHFGLQDPVHTRVTKQALGFGSNSESYILEFSKFSETDEIFIAADLGRMDLPLHATSEKSLSVNYAKYTTEKSKLGASLLFGENNRTRRSLVGLYGIGSWDENSVVKFEADYQQSHEISAPSTSKNLVASMASWGYQLAKGVLPYVILEVLHRDLDDSNSQQTATGVGLQWLPIPHVELQAEYRKQSNKSSPMPESDSGWILFHLYL